MDEATSALDYNTNNSYALICRVGQKAEQSSSLHRLGSIKTSDLILVMDQGRLVEQGVMRGSVPISVMQRYINSKRNKILG